MKLFYLYYNTVFYSIIYLLQVIFNYNFKIQEYSLSRIVIILKLGDTHKESQHFIILYAVGIFNNKELY